MPQTRHKPAHPAVSETLRHGGIVPNATLFIGNKSAHIRALVGRLNSMGMPLTVIAAHIGKCPRWIDYVRSGGRNSSSYTDIFALEMLLAWITRDDR